MSRARSVLAAKSRQNSSNESEPLYSALNSVNLFLGNPIIRKVIRGLCADDRQVIYDALSLYSGQNDLALLKKLKLLPICAFVELGRLSFHVDKSKMQNYFGQQVTRRGLSNIVKSVAEYGITKPLKLQAPFLVVWNYTDACNLRCKHCYQGAGKMSKDELSLDERLKIVDQLAENDVVAIAFSGGEALLRDDFWEVARYASSKGLYLSLATNGTLLTKDVVRRLQEVGVEYFEISLDSVDPAKHDAFRGISGAWERTVAGIQNVVAQEGAYSCIANTVTNENFRELDDLVAFSKKLGVNRTLIFNFIPVGRGAEIIDMDLPPDAREHVLQQMYGYLSGQDESFEILTTAPQFSRVCMMNSRNGIISLAHFGAAGFSDKVGLLAEYIGGCGAGRMYCAIQPNGIVTPCVFMPIPVGDLRSESFIDIWKNAEVMQSLRERHDLKEHCGSCDYKNVCGGCRARAYAYFNDIKAPDIGCIYNLRAYNALKDKLRARSAAVETTEAAQSSF
ncbi:MAG: radical SAM protein [Halobacteriota archaeon]